MCLGPGAASVTADREALAALFWVAHDAEAPALEESVAFAAEWRELLEEPRSR